MTNHPFERIEQLQDLESVNHHAEAVALGDDPDDVMEGIRAMSRDNARTPMQWDASPHAGFTSGTPWLPVNPNHVDINVEAATADPDGVFHHHRRLIELRHTDEVVVHGDFTMLLPDDEQVYAFTRHLDGTTLLTVCNVSSDPAAVHLPDAEAWAGADLVLANRHDPGEGRWGHDGTLTLRPWEALVLRC